MNNSETITTRSAVQVRLAAGPGGIEISLVAPAGRHCLLHWGLGRPGEKKWLLPPQSLWPAGTQPAGPNSVQTPFAQQNVNGSLLLRWPGAPGFDVLAFALFFPEENRWDNNGGQDYRLSLASPPRAPAALAEGLRAQIGAAELVFEKVFDAGESGRLAAMVAKAEDRFQVLLLSDIPGPLTLHWGIARRSPREWIAPPESLRPPGTVLWQETAAQTPFASRDGLQQLRFEFPAAAAPLGLPFVLKQDVEGTRWLKTRDGNFYLPIQPQAPPAKAPGAAPSELANEIIRAETSHNSWTLMHRFNLCYDLLERVQNDLEGQALIFVWLRFSAIRQLTWQRNYNTKPRELAHAQERLTQKLADMYRLEPAVRPLARLSLSTVGRGGEGQRIRDEILNIMHRHHVKEVSGHFLEEWHQKLHNNTTPDDVVICEAFLEFLRTNGNLDRFYEVLKSRGVTRERLESFERPIRSQPQFVPHLKDALLHDFGEFLRILKASHSGSDLETAANAARDRLDGSLQGLLNYIWDHRNDPGVPLVEFARRLTELRRKLAPLLGRPDGSRELLYLDLALEQLLRGVVERNIHLRLAGEVLADLIARVLENVTLSYEDPELAMCSRHWAKLQSLPRFSAEWALHAKSVADRISRALGTWIDRFYQLLQPKAEYLGRGFQAEDWTITLFSEEVVRGNSLGFALSSLMRHLDPLLRRAAHMGVWQIVSRGRASGRVEVVDTLGSIQRAHFKSPTVIVAAKVLGDEEIPAGVTAVLAPDVTDIVSHVAVRARNAGLLFASCHDADLFEHLKSLQGHHIALHVNPAGDVILEETNSEDEEAREAVRPRRLAIAPRQFTSYALSFERFNDQSVGGKACHLAELRGKLSDGIKLPASAAIPFGVCEKVLGLEINRDVARRYRESVPKVGDGDPEVLSALRDAVLALNAPGELTDALRRCLRESGVPWPSDWPQAWHCIKQVWASKWNQRAVLARNRLGIPHENLFVSVLVQETIPADYAFVLHTVNPSTGDTAELYGELVLGLGETLVGNYPGRAMGFVWNKHAQAAEVRTYPSKSIALYGSGLIFRSDSNGEDLAGYAGAGLYDSVLLAPPRQAVLDYSNERLVWDETYRGDLLSRLGRLGLEVEKAFGAPQDVEGVVSQGQYFVVQSRPQTETKPPRSNA